MRARGPKRPFTRLKHNSSPRAPTACRLWEVQADLTSRSSSRRPVCDVRPGATPTTIVRFHARTVADREQLRTDLERLAERLRRDHVRIVVCEDGPRRALLVFALFTTRPEGPRLPRSVRSLMRCSRASYSGVTELGRPLPVSRRRETAPSRPW